jgi:hypothetical protein
MRTKLGKCDLKSIGDFIISRLRSEILTTMTRTIAILWDVRP